MKKTATIRSQDVKRAWHLVDAEGQTLGRLATQVAQLLRGKGKVDFSYHVDGGDYVVVINAAKIRVTGNKLTDKKYYNHSGYVGNLKTISLDALLRKDPTLVIKHAVKGMLPHNRIGADMLRRLKVSADAKHAYSQVSS
ncbi:MAG TPA: 50S ribosomal protein L13 [bacterium]|nr:50S ribosomal protein L13 [bacterium]